MLLYMMVYCAASMESLQDYVVSKNQKLIIEKIRFDTEREDGRQTVELPRPTTVIKL